MAMMFSKNVGYTIGGLLNFLLMIPFVLYFVGLQSISSFTLIVFLMSLSGAFLVSFLLSYCFGLFGFWLKNAWGLKLVRWHIGMIFSGELMALSIMFKIGSGGMVRIPVSGLSESFIQSFFKVLGVISYCLPFQAISYTPSAIYSGIISGTGNVFAHLVLQLFWVVALFGFVKLLWKYSLRCISVQGG